MRCFCPSSSTVEMRSRYLAANSYCSRPAAAVMRSCSERVRSAPRPSRNSFTSCTASVRGAGSSPHQLGLEPAVHLVGDLVDRAWLAAGLPSRNGTKAAVAAVFMAGADLPSEETALADAVVAQGWAQQNHIANDVFAVLWAATGSGF